MSDDAIPAGFVLVPRELTHAMLDATCDIQADDAAMRDRWAALLDAAPKLPTPAPCKASGDDGAGEVATGSDEGAREVEWRPFVHQRDVPTDGTWFVARSTKSGWSATRVVRYADKSDRLPTDGTGWVWPSEPMEWMPLDDFAALAASRPTDAGAGLPGDVRRLVVAARRALEADDWASHQKRERMRTLDAAVEAFSTRVRYDDEPDALATPKPPVDANTIERQDAQEAMGLIADAKTLDEAQAIAIAFLTGDGAGA